MHIRHLEKIFSMYILVHALSDFSVHAITMLFIQAHFIGSHTYTCRFLLLSNTIFNFFIFICRNIRSIKFFIINAHHDKNIYKY